MDYNIHLENFDGPLDLLLHLVRQTKLDIYEINMSEIIENYLNYIHTLKYLNIDISSEFLVMAASLVHLKSKMLIGHTEETEEDDEFNINSEEDLKSRIIEYEKYKNITSDFQELQEKRNQIFTKIPENLKNYLDEPLLINDGLTKDDLLKALMDIEKRMHYKEPVETKITRKEISVKERVNTIRDYLKFKKRCLFEELFEIPTKDYLIATFLAILEMSKAHEIKLFQNNNFQTIEVEAIE